jgi:hypothetical protein
LRAAGEAIQCRRTEGWIASLTLAMTFLNLRVALRVEFENFACARLITGGCGNSTQPVPTRNSVGP